MLPGIPTNLNTLNLPGLLPLDENQTVAGGGNAGNNSDNCQSNEIPIDWKIQANSKYGDIGGRSVSAI